MTIPTADRRSGAVDRGLWFTPFEPLSFLRGSHGQTLAGNYWRRPPFQIPVHAQDVIVDAADGSRVLCHCHWQPEQVRTSRLTLVIVHGLEGSSDSRYVQGITARAWSEGCNIIRMNMRNCGGTETWTPTLYHSGLSNDVNAVLHHFVDAYQLQRVAAIGYSMGGNLVLKLAGELGNQAPPWLIAAVGVSPAADLAFSADALHEPSNRFYEWHFLRNLMRRFRRKTSLFPDIYTAQDIGPIRSIREFDDRITARFSGFTGADDYYSQSSAARVVAQIAIPTLVLHALDDPFIRMTPGTRSLLMANPFVDFVETTHGGHCAFLARTVAPPDLHGHSDRHWAEATLVRYLLAIAGNHEQVHGS
ncbi:YheT family hydrolase [Acidicapsa ligni]|uniref:YheT family hydrolase n=1 Tax=Acidicapsa ligni TaxID=542300 RepID=UPI0021DFB777|nr:alpha/beta fold hydrolase [Acidicapsa ligni]